jgi:hypothetical protein
MKNTLNGDIASIVQSAAGEELLDVKLFIRHTEETSEVGVARQLAQALADRRAGKLERRDSSPERVKSVNVAEFVRGLE